MSRRNFGLISRRPALEGNDTRAGSDGSTQNKAAELIQSPARVLSQPAPANSRASRPEPFIRDDREFAAWMFIGATLLGIVVLIASIYALITQVGLFDLFAFD